MNVRAILETQRLWRAILGHTELAPDDALFVNFQNRRIYRQADSASPNAETDIPSVPASLLEAAARYRAILRAYVNPKRRPRKPVPSSPPDCEPLRTRCTWAT